MSDNKGRAREISDGLLRQRRNILLISVLLPMFFLSGAEIEKINLLGTIILVKNPKALEVAILILYVYFFVRYWQYYKEETHVKQMLQTMKGAVYKQEGVYLHSKIQNEANIFEEKRLNVHFSDSIHTPMWGVHVDLAESKDQYKFPWHKTGYAFLRLPKESKDFSVEELTRAHEWLEKSSCWEPFKTEDPPEIIPNFYRIEYSYNYFSIIMMRLKGYSDFILHTSYFTDYQLPFIVAISAGLGTLGSFLI